MPTTTSSKQRDAEHNAALRQLANRLVGIPPPLAANVALEPLLDEPLIAAVPAGHHLAEQPHLPVSALRDEPFVIWPRWRSPRPL